MVRDQGPVAPAPSLWIFSPFRRFVILNGAKRSEESRFSPLPPTLTKKICRHTVACPYNQHSLFSHEIQIEFFYKKTYKGLGGVRLPDSPLKPMLP